MPMRGAVTISHRGARRHQLDAPAADGLAVQVRADAERLREPAGAAAEEVVAHGSPPRAHLLEADRRLERAHEHRRADALFSAADEVEHPVDPVAAVDVRAPCRPEHRRVASRRAGKAVRGGIVALVGLALDDDAADAVDGQERAEQLARHDVHIAREERRGHALQSEASTSASVSTTRS